MEEQQQPEVQHPAPPEAEVLNDKEAAIAAVTEEGFALGGMSEVLKGDRDVVLAAVTQNAWALDFASEELKSDKEFVLAVVTQNGRAFSFVSEELKCDKEVVLATVTQHGWALGNASKELKCDKEFVLVAVAQNGRALKYASIELQIDSEVVLAAMMQLLMKEYKTKQAPDEEDGVPNFIRLLVSYHVLAPLDVIHVASACGLHWNHGMSKLIKQDYSVLESKDASTGLLPFMTFACGGGGRIQKNDIDLNTLFEIVKKHPQTVRLYNNHSKESKE